MVSQAAGRIHRLGQTRDVLVKRLVFTDSIEGSVLRLHEKLRKGELSVTDGVWPKSAAKTLMKDR